MVLVKTTEVFERIWFIMEKYGTIKKKQWYYIKN